MRFQYLSLFLILFATACSNHPFEDTNFSFPVSLGQPEIPDDNILTQERVLLGRKLFYDNRLSADGSVSCASCHLQEYAFSDTVQFSSGFHHKLGFRNAPTLTNIAYAPLLMRDGGVYDLELQVLVPVEDTAEMNNPITDVAKRLENDLLYRHLSRIAYNRNMDTYVIVHALAAFERTLISADSRYDQYVAGNDEALNQQEISGKQLFESLNCVECHKPPHFTDYSFRNNGLVFIDEDSGRARVTGSPADRGNYRVPTLRNIALTAPYMHDGSYPNLDSVLESYSEGGVHNNNKSNIIKPFALNTEEKKSLIAFLKTLTDTTFVTNPDFGPLP